MTGQAPLKFLIPLCFLAVIIVLELRNREMAIAPPVISFNHPVASRHHSVLASANPPARLVAAILARPLFSPVRRPAPSAHRANQDKTTPRLSGIIIDGANRLAMFAGPHGGKPITVTKGERVGNWVVVLVQPGWVTLAGPEGLRRIRPMFAHAPATSLARAPNPDPTTVAMAASRRALDKLLGSGQ